jgi:hypothetical protein
VASAKQAEADAIATLGTSSKRRKQPSQTDAAKRQRAYRAQEDLIAKLPPVPVNVTPLELRAAVRETGEEITKTLTWATEKGVGHSQEAKNLSLAAKSCSRAWTILGEIPAFIAQEKVCDCARCVAWLDPKTQAAPFGNLAENAWRAVHLARVSLPKMRGDHSFHMSAKDWIFTLYNCIEEAQRASESLRGESNMSPIQVWMHVHRAEVFAPGGLLEKVDVAASVLAERRQQPAPLPTYAQSPRPLSKAELADLGV